MSQPLLRLRPIGLALRSLLCEEGNMTHSRSVQTATSSTFGCGVAALCLFVAISLLLCQLSLHPFKFLADVVHDIAGFEAVREYVPRIRLDLELSRHRIGFVEPESILNSKARSPKRSEVIQKHGHVNMCPPFARTRVRLPRGESVFEIEEHRELAVFFLQRLGQINGLSVAMQHVDGFLSHLGHVYGGCLLQLENGNARIDELLQRDRNVFVFDGLMANVEHRAQMTPQC